MAEEGHAVHFFMFYWFCLSPPTGTVLIFPSPSSLSHSHFSCIPISTPEAQAQSFYPGLHVARVTGSSEKRYLPCTQFQPFAQPIPVFHIWLVIQPTKTLPNPSGIQCQPASFQLQWANPQPAMVKTETRFPLSFPAIPFIIVLWNSRRQMDV